MTLDDALATAETAPPGSVSAILRAEILRLRGERRPPDGWVEVVATAWVDRKRAWGICEEHVDTGEVRDFVWEAQRLQDVGDDARFTLIRAYVPPPEPILEVTGEAETISTGGKTNG